MTPVLREAPDSEPLTLLEAREHLKISGSSQDNEIARFVKAARGVVERYLNRALITQEWDVYFDCWQEKLLLHYAPLQTVDAVKYFDSTGTERTLPTSAYWVTKSDPACIVRAYDSTWPELQSGRPDVIKVEITTGYGDSGSSIPEEIKDAIKIVLTDLYDNRGSVVIGSVQKIPGYLDDLIHSYKLYQF
jgi:uncharacterized phiE125 gp8 family phage protein